jgi:methyl-accepting chemotaxis protein
MKLSIRTKFTLGMLFFFVIIASLSVLSAYYLSMLSNKTDAILKENHFSVIYARNMAEGLTALNQEITRSFVTGSIPDEDLIGKASASIGKSLQLEKNNITEIGEDNLASGIESGFQAYRDEIARLSRSPVSNERFMIIQSEYHSLYQQIMLLSQMNEKAIILKANDAKDSSQKGLRHVTILATICFIIAISSTFNFAAYFNGRFSKLYNGIKEIGSGNYAERLNFEGEDEFYDISLIFNDMANSLDQNKHKTPENFREDFEKEITLNQVAQLKSILEQMKDTEERAVDLIAKLEHKE